MVPGKGECFNFVSIHNIIHLLLYAYRSQEEVSDTAENSPPPTKVPRADTPPSPAPTPPGAKVTLLIPSPEQKVRTEKNKLEAESKMITKKFGADRIGHSWMNALHTEFKKPYINTVSINIHTAVSALLISVLLFSSAPVGLLPVRGALPSHCISPTQ